MVREYRKNPSFAYYFHRYLSLNNPKGHALAIEKFGQELVESFPRYGRGSRRGTLRGHICWIETTKSGITTPDDTIRKPSQLTVGRSNWRLAMDTKGKAIIAYIDDQSGHMVKVVEPIRYTQKWKFKSGFMIQ
jgi:hypothetical protein